MAGGKRPPISGYHRFVYWIGPCPHSESDGLTDYRHVAVIVVDPDIDDVEGPEEDIYSCPICGKAISGWLFRVKGWKKICSIEIIDGEQTLNVTLKKTSKQVRRRCTQREQRAVTEKRTSKPTGKRLDYVRSA